jgi:protein disulfide isomerase
VKHVQHVQNLGITQTPGLLIAGDRKFLYRSTLDNAEELDKFFTGYEQGTLEPFLRSQEIPVENTEDVYVLVGKSFSDVVGHDKDVLVEFYAPWCGHCKKLAPEYEKVGKAFSDVSSLLIAKIDATENDTPEDIRGFPTLIFYPKATKTGVKYSGERKADAIIDWLKGKATVDISALKSEL